MRKVLVVIVLTISMFAAAGAQQGGTFTGTMGIGLTAAQGDFADDVIGFSAGSGFGLEGGLNYYILRGVSIGGFINLMRFGSTYPTDQGRLNFSYSQIGGQVKLNLFGISDGVVSVAGGGGIFTPSAHYYIPDNSYDVAGDSSGTFFFGGLGISSSTDRNVIYEFEVRYNIARAGYTLETIESNVWDFIYAGIKVSFASKGKGAPPRY
ncbi:MAG: hypothetical protein V3W18_10685 [candidate division Zixibacteria bacterium]